jgi:hypothetical protein
MNPNLPPLATVRAQVDDWLAKTRAVTPGALIDSMTPALVAMRGIERDVVTIVMTLHEGLTDAEAERDALRARAEAAEAALATARAEGAAALLSDVLALLDKSAAHDRAKAQCISGDDRDALDTRATVTELICTSLAAHFGGPVEGA